MDLTPHHFNPAGRLYEFLRYSLDRESRVSVSQAWAGYLLVDEYSVDFFAGLSEVLSLPQQSRDAFHALPTKTKLYIDEEDLMAALDRAFHSIGVGSQMLPSSVEELKRNYGKDVVTEIKNLSNVFRGEFQGRAGDSLAIQSATSTLETVKGLADELLEALEEDDGLEPDLRMLLLNQALAFRQSVSLARAGGIEAVGLERDRAVGLVVAHPTVAAELRRKPKLRVKLLALIAAAGVVASAFNGIIESAENVDQLIEAIMAGPEDSQAITDALPGPKDGSPPPDARLPTP